MNLHWLHKNLEILDWKFCTELIYVISFVFLFHLSNRCYYTTCYITYRLYTEVWWICTLTDVLVCSVQTWGTWEEKRKDRGRRRGREKKKRMRCRKLQEEMRRKEVKWTILEDVKNRKKQETKLRMKQKRD